jgi:hypothetical protein
VLRRRGGGVRHRRPVRRPLRPLLHEPVSPSCPTSSPVLALCSLQKRRQLLRSCSWLQERRLLRSVPYTNLNAELCADTNKSKCRTSNLPAFFVIVDKI